MNMYEFMRKHYKHFNAAACVDASQGWVDHLEKGGKMFLTLAGAMSTAELGISLAEMIRQDKVHAICCTGANLEEDLYNLIAHSHYERIPDYRSLTKQDEKALHARKLNRVTDTCIPEEEAIRRIEHLILALWQKAEKEGKRYFPYEYIYQIFDSKKLEPVFEIDPKNSWLLAAYEKKLPIFVPGWEDSSTANIFISRMIQEDVKRFDTVKGGLELMSELVSWYRSQTSSVGFFQIGGGIAGDFPICVVPLIRQDLRQNCPLWGYFCQISDSTTSYGSYSGATPSEKITWGKLSVDTPSFIIESDATIVAPLVFQYVLDAPKTTSQKQPKAALASAR